jgi:hypothetical protein
MRRRRVGAEGQTVVMFEMGRRAARPDPGATCVRLHDCLVPRRFPDLARGGYVTVCDMCLAWARKSP